MRKLLLSIALSTLVLVPVGVVRAVAAPSYGGSDAKVHIPEADRFLPYARVVHVGDTVTWSNGDSDDHTVVSDDALNTAGNQGTNSLVPPGGTLQLTFGQAGTFVYYCRFHAHLDRYHQPVAPGPDGGIQSPNGNYGTPMSGVIVVLP